MAKIIRDADGNITGTVGREAGGCLGGFLGLLIFLALVAVVLFAGYGLFNAVRG